MRTRFLLITLLLLFSVPVSLASTTVNPIQTVITLTSFSYSPATTITTVSTQQEYIVSDSFPVAAVPGGRFACNIIYDSFTTNAGRVSGTISSDSKIDFYLVSKEDYIAWTIGHEAYCDGPSNALAVASKSTSFNFSVVLPKSGEYRGVFINFDKAITANVSWTVSTTSVFTYTETSSSVVSVLYFSTQSGQTVTSQQQPQSQQQSQSVSIGSNTPIIVTIVIIVVIAGFVIFMMTQRSKAGAKPKKPSKGDKTFCINCGKEIPPKSKFCNSCGATQP